MFRLGKNAEAIPDYEESIRLDPSEGDAYTNRLNIFRVDGDAGRVVALYTEAIRLDPKNAVAHTIRGIARRRLGEFDAALADLAEGYRLDPKSAVTCNGLAWFRATCTAAKFRDGRAAVEAATRASELTRGEDADVLDTLAAAHAEAGDFARAVEMETKAMATPENFSLGEIDNCRARLKLYEAHKPYRE